MSHDIWGGGLKEKVGGASIKEVHGDETRWKNEVSGISRTF